MLKYPKCGVNENDVLKIPFSRESIGSSPISGIYFNELRSISLILVISIDIFMCIYFCLRFNHDSASFTLNSLV